MALDALAKPALAGGLLVRCPIWDNVLPIFLGYQTIFCPIWDKVSGNCAATYTKLLGKLSRC